MASKPYRDEPRPGDLSRRAPGALPDRISPLYKMSRTGRRFWRAYLVFCALCLAGGVALALW